MRGLLSLSVLLILSLQCFAQPAVDISPDDAANATQRMFAIEQACKQHSAPGSETGWDKGWQHCQKMLDKAEQMRTR